MPMRAEELSCSRAARGLDRCWQRGPRINVWTDTSFEIHGENRPALGEGWVGIVSVAIAIKEVFWQLMMIRSGPVDAGAVHEDKRPGRANDLLCTIKKGVWVRRSEVLASGDDPRGTICRSKIVEGEKRGQFQLVVDI